MTRFRRFHRVGGGLLIAVLASCIPSEPDSTKPAEEQLVRTLASKTADELMREWFDLAKDPKAQLGQPRPIQIGIELSNLGPAHLMPLLDVVGDPNSTPGAKVLAVMSLRAVIQPDMASRLQTMTAAGNDATMRACAVDLLSVLPSPDLASVLKSLTDDPEKRVRLAALLGLARRNDADARAGLTALYRAADTTISERSAILLAISDTAQTSDFPLLAEGVADETIDAQTRVSAASALGRVGDSSVVEALTKCTGDAVAQELREMAQAAIQAIQARSLQAKPS